MKARLSTMISISSLGRSENRSCSAEDIFKEWEFVFRKASQLNINAFGFRRNHGNIDTCVRCERWCHRDLSIHIEGELSECVGVCL